MKPEPFLPYVDTSETIKIDSPLKKRRYEQWANKLSFMMVVFGTRFG